LWNNNFYKECFVVFFMSNEKYAQGDSGKQGNGVQLSIRLGLELASHKPEVADFYRAGSTLAELAEKYLPSNFVVSPSVTVNAVHYALRELLNPDERVKICKEHRHVGRSKGGSKGGAISGERNYYVDKVGLVTMTSEDRRDAGRSSAVARGHALYDVRQERSDFGEIFEWEHVVKLRKNKVPWKEITQKTNALFGNDRSQRSLTVMYSNRWSKVAYLFK